jgi:DNA repair exonuclease SbcCD ATPase subunit
MELEKYRSIGKPKSSATVKSLLKGKFKRLLIPIASSSKEKDLEIKLAEAEINLSRTKREKEELEFKYFQLKSGKPVQVEEASDEEIGNLGSARQRIMQLQKELETQTKYSGELIKNLQSKWEELEHEVGATARTQKPRQEQRREKMKEEIKDEERQQMEKIISKLENELTEERNKAMMYENRISEIEMEKQQTQKFKNQFSTKLPLPTQLSGNKTINKRRNGSNSVMKQHLNMSAINQDKMPPLDRSLSNMSKHSQKSNEKNLNFVKSSKDKLFTLDTQEDKDMMDQIDQFEPEQLRINLLQQIKENSKLARHLEAVKSEMASKISLLRREIDSKVGNLSPESLDKTQKLQFLSQPKISSTLAQKSKTDDLISEYAERIRTLEKELQNQEKFFRGKLREQADYSSKMQEEAITGEGKFKNMMEKLSEEQSRFYADKKKAEIDVKDTLQAANRKVRNCADG